IFFSAPHPGYIPLMQGASGDRIGIENDCSRSGSYSIVYRGMLLEAFKGEQVMKAGQDNPELKHIPEQSEMEIEILGSPRYESPLKDRKKLFVGPENGVMVTAETLVAREMKKAGREIPYFEMAGPREKLFFDPEVTSCAIVTCGGLCPGLNDVIRSITLTLTKDYGINRILGFQYGYEGLSAKPMKKPVFLTPEKLETAHHQGGTIIGTSRGPQDIDEMVDTLVEWKVDILFAVGGDGTLRGAEDICGEIKRRHLDIAVVGVPKTIDNDLMWISRSFGFGTAVKDAQMVLRAAHTEARSAWNGIGLVKLMGRKSGFIAAESSLTNADVDFCLVPEVPFILEGEGGFLDALEKRLARAHHAVVVVAEGAGQNLLHDVQRPGADASGNILLKDIGIFLKERMQVYLKGKGFDFTIKYIDPSYIIRSLPANASDSGFCLVLGQHAVHAALSGRTNMLVGHWNNIFTHVPLKLAARTRRKLDPLGETWQRVLDSTLQPEQLTGK
ncbi:MAG: ATP-dependent 6-phosphofructokinase, partial [Anaerolineales bacterium]|nr:ATP-dependent 6-phosphofructokinase [Anaerolineales bacterium]